MRNPTFDTDGNFVGYCLNKTNDKLIVNPLELSYYPQPPQKWQKGKDWNGIDKYGIALPFCQPYKVSNAQQLTGAYLFFWGCDRSAKHVANDVQYIFSSKVELGCGSLVKFCFKIIGQDSGSIVLPGFGLYDLNMKPKEWTYIYPQDFQGQWGISIVTSALARPYTLSVVYKKSQKGVSSANWSGFTFEVEGVRGQRFAGTGEETEEEVKSEGPCILEIN